MKSISKILKNLKNLLPYFLLIAIYFFFVNLEARKENVNIRDTKNENILSDDKSSFDGENLRMRIPVIPFEQ